jgi:uncharacterized protein (DUF433 family)
MIDRVEIHPDVCNGRAVIRGTRISVATILGFLSAGDSIDDILDSYSQLIREDILACLEYAHQVADIHTTAPTIT